MCNAGFRRKVKGESANVCGDDGAAIREMDEYAGGDGVNIGEGGIRGDVVPGPASVHNAGWLSTKMNGRGGCCGR